MALEFQKLPINTWIGASWSTLRQITRGRKIDKGYRMKYFLTAAICRILSLLKVIEDRKYKKLLADKPIEEAPVFILGHWRSGTTFVHNVLSKDKNFGYNTTYQTVFPFLMLFGQKFFKRTMALVMPTKRPADNMELKVDLPQEEEFALSNMIPYSFYNFWFLPKYTEEYARKYLLFEDITEKELNVFDEAFIRLVKTSLYNTGGKRFLSKNPPNTGRIPELLKLFPNAKFIYINRNPYTIFESTRNFFCNTIQPLKLQDYSNDQIEEQILKIYADLHHKYQKDKVLIPEGNLIEIAFEEFEESPLEVTKKIYETLSLSEFEKARPEIEKYLEGKKGYKKNKYTYAPETIEKVNKYWSFIKQNEK